MSSRQEKLTALGLILIFIALAASSAMMKSATVDEFAHLPAGLYTLKTQDFGLYAKTPPLGRLFLTAPIMLLNPQVSIYPDRYQEGPWRPWYYAADFMRQNREKYNKILMVGRGMAIFAGVLVCLLVWRTGNDAYGEMGGLVALAACALSPTLIAHSRLVTTDVLAALMSFVFLISMIKYYDLPSTVRAGSMSAAAGLAALTKFTCLFWAPFALAAPLLAAFTAMSDRADRPSRPKAVLHLLTVIVIFWGVLVGGYMGKGMGLPKQIEFKSKVFKTLAPVARYAPLPAELLSGLDDQLLDAQGGEWSKGNYLMGEWYGKGKPYYYLVALAAKEPLPHLALFALAALLAIFRKPRDRDELLILFTIVSFFAAASLLGSLQIGIRYLLPVYPAAFLMIGKLGGIAFAPVPAEPETIDGRPPPGRMRKKIFRTASKVLLVAALSWLLVADALIWPDFLANFNPLAGGPSQGEKILLDSNLDWGQDLPGLAKWMKKNNVESLDLAYFGHDDPARFGINYTLPGEKSGNDYVAISVTFLKGKKYPMTFLAANIGPDDPLWKEIARYAKAKPVAEIGHTIYIFEKLPGGR